MEENEGINILIERAYIERLEIDIIEKVKAGWHDFVDAIVKCFDWVFDVDEKDEKEAD